MIIMMFVHDSTQAQCDPNDTTAPTVICRDVNTTFHPSTCSVAIWPKEVVFNAYDDTTPMEHLKITFDPEGRRNSITLTADGGLRQTIDVYVTDLCGNQTVCRPTVDINDNTGLCVDRFDLALRKTLVNAGTGLFQLGDTVSFQIQVFNQGSDDAFNVEIIDYIPEGLTLTDNNWTLNGSTATINDVIPIIPSGESAIVTIDFVIDQGFTGTTIVNVAEISFADDDQDPTNTPPIDTDSTPDTNDSNDGDPIDDAINDTNDEDDQDPAMIVVDRFDLSIQKTLNTAGPFELGDVVEFEIAVTNEGSITGNNIGITEFPDSSLNFFSTSAPANSNVIGTDTDYTILTLAPGQTETFTVSYTIDNDFEGDLLMNVVEITADNGDDIDSDPDIRKDTDDGLDRTANNDDDDEDMVMINIDRYDLSIQKSIVSSQPFQPGSLISFEITVVNEGSLDAANVGITEFPDSELIFDALLDNANVTAVSNSNYTIASLPAGSTETFTVTYQIDPNFDGSSLMNVVEITSDDGDDIDSNPDIRKDSDDGLDDTATGDDDGGNIGESDDDDEDMVMIPVNRYDLSLQKSIVNDGPYVPGQIVIYEILVTNEGSLPASDIEVTEFPDPNFEFNQVGPATGTGVTRNGDIYTIDTIAPGTSVSIRIQYRISEDFMGTQLMNIAEITADDGDDVDSNPDIRKDTDDNLDDTIIGDDDGGNIGESDDDDEDMVVIPVVQTFDLALQKVIDTVATPGPYMAGDTVEFTLSVINEGTVDAFDIDIRDIPQSGLSQPVLTFGQLNVLPTGLADVFTVDFVGAGQTFSFNVQSVIATDFMGDCLFNVAEIFGASDEDGGADVADIDSTPNDNEDDDDDQDQAKVIIFQSFDLALTKVLDVMVTPGPYMAGDRVEFTISIINQGTLDAFNIDVQDRNPNGLSNPVLIPQAGITQNAAGDFVISSIAAGQTYSFNVEAFIDEGFMDDCIINVAEIMRARDSSGSVRADDDSNVDNDDASEDDQDQAKVNVGQVFDLALIKVVDTLATPRGGGPFLPGDPVRYTVTVVNQGTLNAFDISVMDMTPAGLSTPILVGGQTGVSGTNGTGVFDIAMINAGASFSFDIQTFIDIDFIGVELINDAEIISASNVSGGANFPDVDSTPGDDATPDDLANDNDTADTGGGDDQDPALITVEQTFDLALRKTLSSGQTRSVFSGDTVSFDITVFNQGTINATRVDLVEYVPMGLQLIQENGWGALNTQNESRRNNIISGGLAPGQSTTVQARFVVTTQQQGEIINAAEIIGGINEFGIQDCDSTEDGNGTNDDLINDDIGTACDTNNDDEDDHDVEAIIVEIYDLALMKTDNDDGAYQPGDDVPYQIMVINQGSIPSGFVTVTDYVPNGMSLSPVDNNGWIQDGANITNSINNVGVGQTVTLDLVLRIDNNFRGLNIRNWAEISSDSGNDIDSTPDGINFNQPGETNDLADDDVKDENGMDGGDEDDHDPTLIAVRAYDLSIQKSILNGEEGFELGDMVEFEITVVNEGTLDAANIEVTDFADPGLIFISQGNNNSTNVTGTNPVFTIADLDRGDSETFTLIYQIDSNFSGDALMNIVEITSDDGDDVDSDPNSDKETPDGLDTTNIGDDDGGNIGESDDDDEDMVMIVVGRDYDLAIDKEIVTDGPFQLGDEVTFRITVTNEGQIDAANVGITDFPDAGLIFAGTNATTNGNVSGTMNDYVIADLDIGDSEVFEISYTISSTFGGSQLMNIVEITADDGDDIDSDPDVRKDTDDLGDGIDDDDEDMVIIPLSVYDLSITKEIVSDGPFELGDEVTFRITVTNEGQIDAANVGITDFPDAGLIFVGTNVNTNGNVSGNMNDYVVADLDVGDTEVFEITYSISSTFGGSQLMNIIEIIADDGNDIDSDPDVRKDIDDLGDGVNDDDEDMVIIPLDRYDLSIQKETISTGPFGLGDQVTFRITVVNEGSLDAANIEVTDFPDEDLLFSSVNLPANVTAVAGQQFQFIVASLPAGATETFDITVEISANTELQELMNIAEITADDGDDVDSDPDIRKADDDARDDTDNGDDDGGNVGEADDDDEDMVTIVVTPEELCPCPDEEFIGQAVVTCSAGAFGNNDVAAILDLRPANLATPGDDWAAPVTNGADVLNITNPTRWTIQQLGQIYGTSVGNTDGNIFFGASNVYAYDGDPFTPVGVGPGGEQGIYATNFTNPNNIQPLVTTSNTFIANPVGGTVVPGRFLNTNISDNPLPTGWGNIAYDELTNTIYGSNLSDGRIYAIDATSGVIRQVIDPFPGGGQGFLANPYQPNQVVWAIELNECTRQIFFIQQNVAGGGEGLGDGGGNRTKTLYTLDINNANGMLSNQQLFQTINDGTREKITDIDFSTDCSRMILGERGTVHNSAVFLYELNAAGNNYGLLTDISVGSIDGGDPWEFGLNSSGGVAFGSDQASSDAGICDTLIWAMADCLDPELVPGECNAYGAQGTYIPSGNITDLSGDINATGIFADITPEFILDPRFSKFGLGDIEIFNCCCPGIGNAASALQSGQIAGAVIGPNDRGAVNFSVNLSGEEIGYDVTDNEGQYGFESLEMNRSYTVSPSKVDHMVSGVTTLDLILIQNHILGTREIEDPKLLIAADINGSGTINALDIIDLRRAILGLSFVTPTSEAWRFVTVDSEVMKGYGGMNYDEEYDFRSLESSQYGADFYAIKVGDVNNTLATAKSRTSNFQTLKIKKSQSSLKINTSREVDFMGMQMSVDLRGQQLLDITSEYVDINEGNYSIVNGILRVSFQTDSSVDLPTGSTLFELHFAGIPGTIELTDHINAETYDSDLLPSSFILTEDFAIDGYSLGQNNPNPTSGSATIDFVIPSAQTVEMNFYTLDGRLIGSIENSYPAGRNVVVVDAELTQHNTGSIIYKMITEEFVATKKMIIVR